MGKHMEDSCQASSESGKGLWRVTRSVHAYPAVGKALGRCHVTVTPEPSQVVSIREHGEKRSKVRARGSGPV